MTFSECQDVCRDGSTQSDIIDDTNANINAVRAIIDPVNSNNEYFWVGNQCNRIKKSDGSRDTSCTPLETALCPCKKSQNIWKTVSTNACFSSTDKTQSTTFTAPNNGDIKGIRIRKKSGSLNCRTTFGNNGNDDALWGCTANEYGVYLLKGNTKYYPQSNSKSTKWVNIADYEQQSKKVDIGLNDKFYKIPYGNAINDEEFDILGPLWNIKKDETFKLEFIDASTSYPSGNVCAEVDFLYTIKEPVIINHENKENVAIIIKIQTGKDGAINIDDHVFGKIISSSINIPDIILSTTSKRNIKMSITPTLSKNIKINQNNNEELLIVMTQLQMIVYLNGIQIHVFDWQGNSGTNSITSELYTNYAVIKSVYYQNSVKTFLFNDLNGNNTDISGPTLSDNNFDNFNRIQNTRYNNDLVTFPDLLSKCIDVPKCEKVITSTSIENNNLEYSYFIDKYNTLQFKFNNIIGVNRLFIGTRIEITISPTILQIKIDGNILLNGVYSLNDEIKFINNKLYSTHNNFLYVLDIDTNANYKVVLNGDTTLSIYDCNILGIDAEAYCQYNFLSSAQYTGIDDACKNDYYDLDTCLPGISTQTCWNTNIFSNQPIKRTPICASQWDMNKNANYFIKIDGLKETLLNQIFFESTYKIIYINNNNNNEYYQLKESRINERLYSPKLKIDNIDSTYFDKYNNLWEIFIKDNAIKSTLVDVKITNHTYYNGTYLYLSSTLKEDRIENSILVIGGEYLDETAETSKVYTFEPYQFSFDDAQTYCENVYGTGLTKVLDPNENWLATELCIKSEINDCWIGLRNDGSNGTNLYRWRDFSFFDTENDYQYWKPIISNNYTCWIGFNTENSNGIWKWTDNSQVSYTNWKNFGPNNDYIQTPFDGYAKIHSNGFGKWSDSNWWGKESNANYLLCNDGNGGFIRQNYTNDCSPYGYASIKNEYDNVRAQMICEHGNYNKNNFASLNIDNCASIEIDSTSLGWIGKSCSLLSVPLCKKPDESEVEFVKPNKVKIVEQTKLNTFIEGKIGFFDIKNNIGHAIIKISPYSDLDISPYLMIKFDYINEELLIKRIAINGDPNGDLILYNIYMNKDILKESRYWFKFNNKPGKRDGFIALGFGDILGRNIIYITSFDTYVQGNRPNGLRKMLSYAEFRFLKTEALNSVITVYELPSSDIELNSFVEQFGILVGNAGSDSSVIINLYHKNYAYSCRLESPNIPDKKYLCSNIEYSQNERCDSDAFSVVTNNNKFAMQIITLGQEYLFIKGVFVDDFFAPVEPELLLSTFDTSTANEGIISFATYNAPLYKLTKSCYNKHIIDKLLTHDGAITEYNSPEYCDEVCAKDFNYFALFDGFYCYCGNLDINTDITIQYKGCDSINSNSTLFEIKPEQVYEYIDIKDCDGKCSLHAFDYFLIRNNKCLCINDISELDIDNTILQSNCDMQSKSKVYRASRNVNETLCDINCPGDSSFKCGDTHYVTLYKATEYPILSSDNTRHINKNSVIKSTALIDGGNQFPIFGVIVQDTGDIVGRLSLTLNKNGFSYFCHFVVNAIGKYTCYDKEPSQSIIDKDFKYNLISCTTNQLQNSLKLDMDSNSFIKIDSLFYNNITYDYFCQSGQISHECETSTNSVNKCSGLSKSECIQIGTGSSIKPTITLKPIGLSNKETQIIQYTSTYKVRIKICQHTSVTKNIVIGVFLRGTSGNTKKKYLRNIEGIGNNYFFEFDVASKNIGLFFEAQIELLNENELFLNDLRRRLITIGEVTGVIGTRAPVEAYLTEDSIIGKTKENDKVVEDEDKVFTFDEINEMHQESINGTPRPTVRPTTKAPTPKPTINNQICIEQFEVIDISSKTENVIYKASKQDIGNGVILQNNCPYAFQSVDTNHNEFLPCIDKAFTLSPFIGRKFTKITMESCNDEVITPHYQSKLFLTITGLNENEAFAFSEPAIMSSAIPWTVENPLRTYNMLSDNMHVISIATIKLENELERAICLDKVYINNHEAYLTDYYLGRNCIYHNCVPSLSAVITWPVCQIDILEVKLEKDLSASNNVFSNEENDVILSSNCRNQDREHTLECSVEKTIEKSTEISWEHSLETGTEHSVVIANSSTNSITGVVSTTFSHSLELNLGADGEFLGEGGV